MKQSLAILIALTSGCSTPSIKQETESVALSQAARQDTQVVRTSGQNRLNESEEIGEKQEVMHLDSVKLNNTVSYSTKQKLILKHLGKPDSITTPNFECGAYISGDKPWGDSIKVWHYPGADIVAFKDRAEILTIRLNAGGWTLNHPKFILSRHTTLSDIAKIFPNSVKNSNEWKDFRNGKTYKLVRLEPKPSWDDQWILRFYRDKLVEVEYWTPC